MRSWRRPIVALLVFVVWAVITAFLGRLWHVSTGPTALNAAVSGALQPSFLVAAMFLFACAAAFRWNDLGLNRPRPASTLVLLWFPALYVGLFALAALLLGLPLPETLAIIAFNTFLAGISEELACRGILYQGLRDRYSQRMTILISTLLFGLVHLLNGFTTGDFGAAFVQSLTAFMSGIVFMAIRIRTGSLYPGMVLHGLWDCALITLGASAADRTGTSEALPALFSYGAPLVFILPNFIYGMILLRGAKGLSAVGRATPA